VTAQPTTAGPAPGAVADEPRLTDLAHAADVGGGERRAIELLFEISAGPQPAPAAGWSAW
jgi:hypothetical protein